MTADECVAEATEEGEVPGPNCSKRFKTVLHPVVAILFPYVFAELTPWATAQSWCWHNYQYW